MKRKNLTRNALFTSILSLLLCVSMLVGTTFAWFTDEVVTGMNTIAAGNLDVKLLAGGAEVDSNTKLFDNVKLWEPGVVVYENLQVVNAGTLALKYQMALNFGNENDLNGHKLSEVLKIAIIDKVADGATRETVLAAAKGVGGVLSGFSMSGELEAGNASAEKTVVIYWEPNDNATDNLYNANNGKTTSDGQPLHIDFGVNLQATQKMSEEDSFGNDYDKDAPNQPVTATEVADAAELKEALANGGNVVLADDIALTSTLLVNKDAVIDLNGKTMTAPSSGAMFQSQSNAAPSMTISSSEPGAEINVTGGDTSVLLGYGSTVISNVTINVTGCDNYSPNPFNVYGDLTLGEGTVVNVDYLGTALISNNGAVKIVIDGAEISVGTFKTNGTAIITLNNASTLEMKNTDIKITAFVLSSFGGDSLVSKVDGVTIDGSCTFDVTDSNGASCTFVAKDGKVRLEQK